MMSQLLELCFDLDMSGRGMPAFFGGHGFKSCVCGHFETGTDDVATGAYSICLCLFRGC